GESARQSGFSRHAANSNAATLRPKNDQAKASESVPAASARPRVRGLAASTRRSTMRLKVMAALRAPTMASTIHPSTGHGGQQGEGQRKHRVLELDHFERAPGAGPEAGHGMPSA